MTLLEKLTDIVEALGEMSANDMGDLNLAQASLFHNATQMLADLEEDLKAENECYVRVAR